MTLGGTSADFQGADSPQSDLLFPVCHRVCGPLTDGGWHSELGQFGVEHFKDDGVGCGCAHPSAEDGCDVGGEGEGCESGTFKVAVKHTQVVEQLMDLHSVG